MTYRAASFRGVTFEVTERSYESGRRNQVHEYPNKDVSFTEDLGKRAERYTLTAFVIGDDYALRRDALKAACLKEGAGTLVHPDFGSVEVVCDSLTIKESYGQQRLAAFELSFVEAGELAIPSSALSLLDNVLGGVSNMISTVTGVFSTLYQVPSQIAGSVQTVQGLATRVQNLLSNLAIGASTDSSSTASTQQTINQLANTTNSTKTLNEDAATLVTKPNELINQMADTLTSVVSLATPSLNALQSLRSLATPISASAETSVNQLELAILELVVTQEAQMIANLAFTAADQVRQTLDTFLTDCETIEYAAPEPSLSTLAALRELKSDVVAYLQEIVLELPKVKTLTLAETQPSLAVAYDLYQDLARASEIVQRNRLAYSAFVPGNQLLEVLTA